MDQIDPGRGYEIETGRFVILEEEEIEVPRGRGIVLWTLGYGDEVRPADD